MRCRAGSARQHLVHVTLRQPSVTARRATETVRTSRQRQHRARHEAVVEHDIGLLHPLDG
jgi:hypothetical protein